MKTITKVSIGIGASVAASFAATKIIKAIRECSSISNDMARLNSNLPQEEKECHKANWRQRRLLRRYILNRNVYNNYER